ncbi:MAG: DUF3795 domain-containing protein [Christensenella sp.]|nr:DUF3795 domain-containing protein [Christensenella sp.]
MKMPIENIKTTMFAPCGMNCQICYRHCCHKKPCGGCLESDNGKPEHCRKCKIKDCVRSRGVIYCFECPVFPCKMLHNLEKSYNKKYRVSLVENSRIARQESIELFLAEQKARYACPRCGGIISVHDGKCSECGHDIG